MPNINILVSKPLDVQTCHDLQCAVANNMEILPGKTAANTMICISDHYTMYRGGQPIEAAFIDIRLYKESPEECKKAFAECLFNIFNNILQIPPSHVQINFIELPCWASNGNYF